MSWTIDQYSCIDFKTILGDVDIVYNGFDEYLSNGMYGEDIALLRIRNTNYYIDIGEYRATNDLCWNNTNIYIDIVYSNELTEHKWLPIYRVKFPLTRNKILVPHVDTILKQVVKSYKLVRNYPKIVKLLIYWASFKEWCWYRHPKWRFLILMQFLTGNNKWWCDDKHYLEKYKSLPDYYNMVKKYLKSQI